MEGCAGEPSFDSLDSNIYIEVLSYSYRALVLSRIGGRDLGEGAVVCMPVFVLVCVRVCVCVFVCVCRRGNKYSGKL